MYDTGRASFLAEGHYLRHLRRMKRLYSARRELLLQQLQETAEGAFAIHATAGLSVRMELPPGTDDFDIALRALPFGIAPVPLSPWYAEPPGHRGLLLGITNLAERRIAADCARLIELVRLDGR